MPARHGLVAPVCRANNTEGLPRRAASYTKEGSPSHSLSGGLADCFLAWPCSMLSSFGRARCCLFIVAFSGQALSFVLSRWQQNVNVRKQPCSSDCGSVSASFSFFFFLFFSSFFSFLFVSCASFPLFELVSTKTNL